MDAIMALCKRRGFIFQASEIYGGINGLWDYGPLGTQLRNNLRQAWYEDMILVPCNGAKGPNGKKVSVVPVDTRIIQHPRVWEASGHIGGFNDPMVDDKETKQRFRADHFFGIFVVECSEEVIDDAVEELQIAFRESRAHPIFTCIASTESEALAFFTEQVLKLSRGTELQVSINETTPRGRRPDVIFRGLGLCLVGEVKRIDEKRQRKLYGVLPSPFTQKFEVLTKPRQFNLMFRTYLGATATKKDIAYLRPETAQGIFTNFKNVVDTTRVKIPFGIGNTGTSFRNEITPRNYTFRSREFEQMEMEFFCHEEEAMEWYAFWREYRMRWWEELGLAGENLILRDHEESELSHYSKGTCDIEYRFPFTFPEFGELEGVAYRGNFDLTQHQEHSRQKLEYFDQERGELGPNGQPKGERYLPHVIEPAAGLDRGTLAILCEAYTVDESRPSPEFMKFHPRLAPIKAAVFPLVNKDGMPEIAENLADDLTRKFGRRGFIEYDPKQSIGKRYARMDEGGCPYCFTIDGDTSVDQTVTVRHRDTGAQERINIAQVPAWLDEKLG